MTPFFLSVYSYSRGPTALSPTLEWNIPPNVLPLCKTNHQKRAGNRTSSLRDDVKALFCIMGAAKLSSSPLSVTLSKGSTISKIIVQIIKRIHLIVRHELIYIQIYQRIVDKIVCLYLITKHCLYTAPHGAAWPCILHELRSNSDTTYICIIFIYISCNANFVWGVGGCYIYPCCWVKLCTKFTIL